MRNAFPAPFDVVARVYSREMDNAIKSMNAHHEAAEALRSINTQRIPGELSFHTHWQASDLLTWGATMREAEADQVRMFNAGAISSRAMMTAYRHACLCRVRTKTPTFIRSLSLAEVAQVFTVSTQVVRDHAPPGEVSRSVLSTCQASNAPGLSACSRKLAAADT
jgi:hypothetical protein